MCLTLIIGPHGMESEAAWHRKRAAQATPDELQGLPDLPCHFLDSTLQHDDVMFLEARGGPQGPDC